MRAATKIQHQVMRIEEYAKPRSTVESSEWAFETLFPKIGIVRKTGNKCHCLECGHEFKNPYSNPEQLVIAQQEKCPRCGTELEFCVTLAHIY